MDADETGIISWEGKKKKRNVVYGMGGMFESRFVLYIPGRKILFLHVSFFECRFIRIDVSFPFFFLFRSFLIVERKGIHVERKFQAFTFNVYL